MPFTFILKCSDNTLYTGTAWDIEKQVWEHQHGQGAYYTKQRLPVKFVYCEEYERIMRHFTERNRYRDGHEEKKTALIEGRREEIAFISKEIYL